MKDNTPMWPLLLFFLVIIVLGFWMGQDYRRFVFEREAVKAGYAEFYIDSAYEKQWRWKEAK